MPDQAMTQYSDSHNPAALPPITCSLDERPPVILTPAALQELYDNAPTLAIKQPFEDDYECPFGFSKCARDYCYGCRSSLLDEQAE